MAARAKNDDFCSSLLSHSFISKSLRVAPPLSVTSSSYLHFNAAGSSLPPPCVVESQEKYLQLEAKIGGYEAAKAHYQALNTLLYAAVAKLINAPSSDTIFITDSATTAWIQLIYSMCQSFSWGPGDIILVSTFEYAANFVAFLQLKKRYGFEVEVVPATPLQPFWQRFNPATERTFPHEGEGNGALDIAALRRLLRQHKSRIVLVAITHIPTNGGLVNPAATVGKCIAEHNRIYADAYQQQLTARHGNGKHRPAKCLFVLDACQTVGQIPIDVQEQGCDAFSATARKYLRGPRGIGFGYIKQDLLQLKIPDGEGTREKKFALEPYSIDHFGAVWTTLTNYSIRHDARRFERWESSQSLRIGLLAAIQYYFSTAKLMHEACKGYMTKWNHDAERAGMTLLWQRIAGLAEALRERLRNIRKDVGNSPPSRFHLAAPTATMRVTVHDIGAVKCGIVTFSVVVVYKNFEFKDTSQKRVTSDKTSPFSAHTNHFTSSQSNRKDEGVSSAKQSSVVVVPVPVNDVFNIITTSSGVSPTHEMYQNANTRIIDPHVHESRPLPVVTTAVTVSPVSSTRWDMEQRVGVRAALLSSVHQSCEAPPTPGSESSMCSVLTRVDSRVDDGIIRASVHYYNTLEEVNEFARRVEAACPLLYERMLQRQHKKCNL